MMSTYPYGSGMGLRVRLKTGSLGNPTTTLHTNSPNILSNQWNHVAMTYDGATLATYVNGQPYATSAQSGPVASDASRPVSVGCSPNAADFFRGKIDEVVIWDRGLSASEILNLYLRDALRLQFQVRVCSDSNCATAGPFLGQTGPLTPILMNQ